jgi:hypothetical protein
MTKGEAIKAFCRKCQGLDSERSSLDAVRDCTAKWGKQGDKLDAHNFPNGCPLWPFRLGKNPNRIAKPMTDEQRAAVADRLRAGKEAKAK